MLRSIIARCSRVLPAPSAAPARLLGALFATIALLALAAAPAGALVVEPKAGERLGLQTRETVGPEVKPLQYHGGPIMTASDTYAIYWDPKKLYHSDWMSLIDRYFHDVGAESEKLGNVFSLDSQYTGPKGTRAAYQSTFRGAYSDTQPYPTSGNCVEPSGEPVCLTDAQVQAELVRFIKENKLPTGLGVIYFVLTPPGVTICTDKGGKGNCSDSTAGSGEEPNGICSYHSAIESTSPSPIVYGVQPWVAGDAGHIFNQHPLKTALPTAPVLACQNSEELVEPNQTDERSPYIDYETGLADVIIDDLSIEQRNITVNPLLTGWYQEGTGAEEGDVCRRIYALTQEPLAKAPEGLTHALNISNETINNDQYYLQWAFNSVGVTSGRGIVCWSGTEPARPHFTAPNPVNVGDSVAFDARESNISLDANLSNTLADEPFDAPVYSWNFGDGSTVITGTEDASVFHSYAYGGSYDVTLTITDSGGNVTSMTNVITVVGPPPPASPGGGSSTPGGGSSSGTLASTVGSPSVGSPPKASPRSSTSSTTPTLAENIPSHSLHKALNHGLQVHYKVNEQVAGNVEVYLSAATAKRLGISGQALTLPGGYPRSVLIGYAVLVTTKAGSGTLNVLFPHAVAERLASLRKVKLTVRFAVHGAGRRPKSVSTFKAVVLRG